MNGYIAPPRKIHEIGANVTCKICGCEFRIRNRRQRRCPGCGANECWFSMEG